MTPQEFMDCTAGIAYHHRGAFFSELYLFVSLCVDRQVNRVIESGVYHGVSSRVFRAVWPGRVTSVEQRPDHVPADLAAVIGDGAEVVPALVASRPKDRLGVFIDGPKGVEAARLRQWCLAQPNVRVVAQHDAEIGSGETAHSHDRDWQHSCGEAIDARIDPIWRSQYAHGCPGMGVWVTP